MGPTALSFGETLSRLLEELRRHGQGHVVFRDWNPKDSEVVVAGAQATLDKLELFRRYHWAVCQALENGQNIPSHLDANVTRERFHALSWYTRQPGFETWDGDTETSVARN